MARALSTVLNGLQWVYNHKQIRLANMSLGFSTDSPPLKAAINKLFDQGAIMVASAGNSCSDSSDQSESAGDDGEGPTCDTPQTTDIKYPAHYQWVIAVTAIDINYLNGVEGGYSGPWRCPDRCTYSLHLSSAPLSMG